MTRCTGTKTRLLLLCFASAFAGPAPADTGRLDTTRRGARALPLPREEGAFHFVIFGDRTGGPPEGLRVLEQAVKDTNLLDPDLVLTVGDLINGYNTSPEWLAQMRAFRAIMDRLAMPWFPVAGNHDIYWRGEDRPPREHEDHYETHFGPLWYSFSHKNAGFVVLFSDEGDPKTGRKAFGPPETSQMSPDQLAWLKRTLTRLRDRDHVFVFLHHPRWIESRYPDNNWPLVHEALLGAGNVRAVFAGHIHRMRYDGRKDGIEYFCLATTGAHLSADLPAAGFLHHLNVVTVRRESYAVSTLPVGTVVDPRQFTPEREQDIDRLRQLGPELVGEPLRFEPDGGCHGTVELRVTNPASRPIEVTLLPRVSPDEWLVVPSHRHATVAPGQSASVRFSCLRKVPAPEGTWSIPSIALETEYLAEGIRIRLPERARTLEARPAAVAEEFFRTTENGVLDLADGRSCLRVPSRLVALPDGPFTLECWVRPGRVTKRQGVVTKTETSDYGIFLMSGKPQFDVFLGDRYVTARSDQPLRVGSWHHLAGVYDGREVRLYVNGVLAGSATGSGARRTNALPLYVGADPDRAGAPGSQLVGRIDEVRLSRGVRYRGEEIRLSTRHAMDEDTLLLLPLDRAMGPFWPAPGEAGAYAESLGSPRCTREELRATSPEPVTE